MSTKFALDFDKDVATPKMGAGKVNPVRGLIKQALEQLPLDQSYHIPKTAEVPEPAKLYSHMVVAENTKWVKFAVEGGKGEFKHFTIRPVDKTDKRGEGARLFRVANITKADAERRMLASAEAAETRATNKVKKAELAKQAPEVNEPESTLTETVNEQAAA